MRVALCVDATPLMGIGHASRSCALADALADDDDIVFVTATEIPRVLDRMKRTGAEVVQVVDGGDDKRSEVLMSCAPDFVVVDGYQFGPELFERLHRSAIKHGVIDDNGETRARCANLVVNQNPGVKASLYDHMSNRPTLLIGLEFALLRPELTSARALERSAKSDQPTAFVSLGGSDPHGLTIGIVWALSEADIISHVAIGPGVADPASIERRISQCGKALVVDEAEFAARFREASFAVIAAGSTMWEAAYLGVPTIAVVVADNQLKPSRAAAELGIVLAIDGRHRGFDVELRGAVSAIANDTQRQRRMQQLGTRIVDGRGAARVATTIRSLHHDSMTDRRTTG